MARTDKLYDHPRSKQAREQQEAKKGDVETDESGQEWVSEGGPEEQTEADKQKPPTKFEKRQFWRKKRKDDDAVPTS